MTRRAASILAALAVVLSIDVTPVSAYVLEGVSWPTPTTTMYVSIPGNNGAWDAAFEDAMNQWSADTVFQFSIVRGQAVDPCNAPNVNQDKNGAKFSTTECGMAWGSSTLAVTQYYSSSGSTLIQAGVVFNSNRSWSVYNGNLQFMNFDFRRVAIHELGHVLGLDHENGVPAIMATHIGNIFNPTADDIAGVAAIYGVPSDTTPDTFTFTDQTGVALAATITSNAVTITGIDAPTPISVSGGSYSIGCGATFTAAAGTIHNGQTVCVRHTSAAIPATSTTTTLTIGGVAGTFTSTTALLADTTPDPFGFTDQNGVALSTVITSNAVSISGINAPAPISVSGGTYSIGCSSAFTGAAGTIGSGQTVCVRHTSAASVSTGTQTTLTVGGVAGTFTSTTTNTQVSAPPGGGGGGSIDVLLLAVLAVPELLTLRAQRTKMRAAHVARSMENNQ